MDILRHLIKTITGLVYPAVCVVCKDNIKEKPSVDNLICLKCWRQIKRNLPPFCHSCGRRLEINKYAKKICSSCARKQLHFDRAFSPCQYEGVVKELIHNFKYKNKDYLGPTLSKLMVEFIKEYNLPLEFIDFIMPLPLHNTRIREREFNQAQVLAACIAKEFNKEILDGALRRNRNTRPQAELEINERFLNVKNSFSVAQDKAEVLKRKKILLIDDVLTTGASTSEAAHALKNAGASIVFVLTLAN